MVKKLFKLVLPVFLSVLFGGICGKLVFSNYDVNINKNLSGKKVYLVQNGAYSNYDNMVSNTLVNNYIYYQDDDGMFKSIIGITVDKKNVDKIKKIYDGDVIISEYYSNDKELNDKLNKYDELLSEVEEVNDIKEIVFKMLELYKDNESVLIQVIS